MGHPCDPAEPRTTSPDGHGQSDPRGHVVAHFPLGARDDPIAVRLLQAGERTVSTVGIGELVDQRGREQVGELEDSVVVAVRLRADGLVLRVVGNTWVV